MSLPALNDTRLPQRFWDKVRVNDETGCWEWTGARQSGGYGVFHPKHGETARAHRVILELTHGRLSPTQFGCHACDNPPCCNPEHLFVGTHDSNMADMRAKGRSSNGASRPTARLTADQVVCIREAAARGEQSCDLAADYGVTESNVCMIIRGLRWSHVGGPITHHYITRKAA